MREYVITAILVNGQTMSRTTANKYFAQYLIKMFIKHDKVTDVRVKIVKGKQSQIDG